MIFTIRTFSLQKLLKWTFFWYFEKRKLSNHIGILTFKLLRKKLRIFYNIFNFDCIWQLMLQKLFNKIIVVIFTAFTYKKKLFVCYLIYFYESTLKSSKNERLWKREFIFEPDYIAMNWSLEVYICYQSKSCVIIDCFSNVIFAVLKRNVINLYGYYNSKTWLRRQFSLFFFFADYTECPKGME